jgi:CRP/FNR family transcriptional regulator, nitrogen fixation regulation protein
MLTQATIRSNISHHPARNVRAVPYHGLGSSIEADSFEYQMQLMGAMMPYARNAQIFGEGDPSEYLYKIVSGVVRTYKILGDGRRQIGGFYLPGNMFGLESGDEHTLAAEAVTDAKVLIAKRSAITALAAHNATVARELYALTALELRRAQGRILLLVKSAQERVASFLLEMTERARTGDIIELPMSRQDIADYLGLTIETVSRTLTSLESAAAIEVPTSRRIVLRNRSALRRLNG